MYNIIMINENDKRYQEIGEKIKKQRESKGKSISELASEANVSKAYISLLETDKANNPSVKIIKQLANALEMQPTELLK